MNVLNLKEQDYEKVETNSDSWLSLENLKNEYWRDIIDFEGLYQVSNYGRVKSLKRKTNNHYCNKDRILKVGKTKQGYYRIGLHKDKKIYGYYVHILVAKAFIPNIHNKPIIDHDKPVEKDYCNNCVYNLRWVTQNENIKHCVNLGRHKGVPPILTGKENGRARPVIQYDLNGNFIKQWWCVNDICKKYNYYHSNILRVIKRKNSKYHGYIWKFGIYKKGGDDDREDNTK